MNDIAKVTINLNEIGLGLVTLDGQPVRGCTGILYLNAEISGRVEAGTESERGI